MPRRSLNDLPMPERIYRPDLLLSAGSKFETLSQAKEEDRKRARLIISPSARNQDLFSPDDATNLWDRLNYRLTQREIPPTLASSAYMRDQRIRLTGALHKLVADHPKLKAATFTLIPRWMAFTPEELLDVDPEVLRERLRSGLNRAGAKEASGAVFACIHGEYEPRKGIFQLHFHGLALGGMIKLVSSLRDGPGFASVRTIGAAAEPVRQRVWVTRKPLANLPYALSYLLKSYWISRWIGQVECGSIKRQRAGSRIDEPFHTLALLWMDRWSLADISLMMNLSVNSSGLRINRR